METIGTREIQHTGHLPEPFGFLSPAAAALDFCAIGVCPAAPVPAETTKNYDRWIDAGKHAAMRYLENWRPQRFDPTHPAMLPGATAIVSVALSYADGVSTAGVWKHICAHSRGADYHITIRKKLQALAQTILSRWPQAQCRMFVDSAPVMERTWAALAGVGLPGRHGSVIVPGVGARILLGELVLAGVPVPGEPTVLAQPACTGCGSCVAACPTGALGANGEVDANRCLSYHTVENTGSTIPKSLAKKLPLVFGCDACTGACPANNPAARCDLETPSSPALGLLDLQDLIAMGDPDLAAAMASTCMGRTGPATIRRNAVLLKKNLC